MVPVIAVKYRNPGYTATMLISVSFVIINNLNAS